jgi:hypothetical protein
MARVVTVHKKEGGGLTVRSGSEIIGFVTRLEGSDTRMSGQFARGPAYAGYADVLASTDAAAIEQRGVHVYSAVHEMRIDDERTLSLKGDRIHFRPTSAFIVLRSGGLG